MARFGHRTGTQSRYRWLRAMAAGLLCIAASHQVARAQNTIGGGGSSGVVVDANGVLSRTMANDPTGELSRQRANEALLKLDRNIARKSPLRKVSLTRLERVVKQR